VFGLVVAEHDSVVARDAIVATGNVRRGWFISILLACGE